jgi:hypothetical protein
MFQTLIASAPSEPPSLTRLLASIGLHALVLSAALALTAMHPTVIMPPREARMPFVLPPLRRIIHSRRHWALPNRRFVPRPRYCPSSVHRLWPHRRFVPRGPPWPKCLPGSRNPRQPGR